MTLRLWACAALFVCPHLSFAGQAVENHDLTQKQDSIAYSRVSNDEGGVEPKKPQPTDHQITSFHIINVAGKPVAPVKSSQAQAPKIKKKNADKLHSGAEVKRRPWFVRTGLMWVVFSTRGRIFLEGKHVPNSNARTRDNLTIGFELGYRLTKNWSVTATAGIPPMTSLLGSRSLSGVTVGKVRYAPAVLNAQYTFTNFGEKFQPYVGAGGVYTLMLQEKSRGVRKLYIDNAFGYAFQAGVFSKVTERVGFFVDYKKIYVHTHIRGVMGPARDKVRAKIWLNPNLIFAGLSYSW